MKPMVLIISGTWPTKSNLITGIFVQQQVDAYVSLGCRVTVIVPQPIRSLRTIRDIYKVSDGYEMWSPRYFNIPQKVSESVVGVEINARLYANAVMRTLKRVKLGPTLVGVHLHELRYSGLSIPYWEKITTSNKVITIHGVDPFISAKSQEPWLAKRLSRTFDCVERIALVGAPLVKYISQLAAPPHKVDIIPNGTWLPSTWNSIQRPVTERRVILSVSNLVPLKGIDFNIRALKKVSETRPEIDWVYRIVGDGPERANLEDLAIRLGLGNRVMFLGRLSYERTLKEFNECDVFSLPSWGEAFGIVYLEAMARGRPVIGCSGWGAEEMISGEMEGLLVPPKDIASLAAALVRLLGDTNLARDMGAAARRRAEGFGWERNVSRYMKIFGISVS